MRVLLLLLVLVAAPVAQERPLPDFGTFAAEVKKHLATDDERQSGYVFTERRVEQKVDATGRVTDESVTVYEVHPGLPGESRYRRLVEEDGRPVPPATLAKRDAERRKKVEEYARKQEVVSERQKDTRRLDKARQEYSSAVDDIFRVFDIRMVRREAVEGVDTIVATLTPKPNVKPQTDDGKVMRHFKARAWISESDYELVRVDIEAIDDLRFGLGLLARVHKGTVATYQRRKVDGETWLPAAVTWTASARVLLLRRLRVRGVSEFSNYRRYSVDTSTTIDAPR
jgi:DNA-binding TFAR19-related protein (PDSD5 family)